MLTVTCLLVGALATVESGTNNAPSLAPAVRAANRVIANLESADDAAKAAIRETQLLVGPMTALIAPTGVGQGADGTPVLLGVMRVSRGAATRYRTEAERAELRAARQALRDLADARKEAIRRAIDQRLIDLESTRLVETTGLLTTVTTQSGAELRHRSALRALRSDYEKQEEAKRAELVRLARRVRDSESKRREACEAVRVAVRLPAWSMADVAGILPIGKTRLILRVSDFSFGREPKEVGSSYRIREIRAECLHGP